MSTKPKIRSKIDRSNTEFRKIFSEQKAKKIFDTMEFIGCDSKVTAMSMAMNLFVKEYGKPLEC